MKSRIVAFLVVILLGLPAASFSMLAKASTGEIIRVLVIQSYLSNDTWAEEINQGVKECLKKSNLNAQIDTYYLNARNVDRVGEIDSLARLCERYQTVPLDLILVCDDEATYSLLKTDHPITYKTPIVFCGVDYPNVELLSTRTNVTGIKDEQNFELLLDLLPKLYPKRKNIYLLVDDTMIGKKVKENFEAHWSEWYKKHSDYRYAEINESQLIPKAFIFCLQSYFITNSTVAITPKWSISYPAYSSLATIPFVGMSDEGLNAGLLCAYTSQAYSKAWEATLMGIKIIQGTSVRDIPIATSKPDLVFDWDQMKRWKLDQKQIPVHSVILNQPFYEKHKIILVIWIISLLALLILFILYILRLYRKEMKARVNAQVELISQASLIKQRNEFNNTLKSVKEGIISLNEKLQIKTINRSAMLYLNLEDDEQQYIGKDIRTFFRIRSGEDIVSLDNLIEKAKVDDLTLSIPEGLFVQRIKDGTHFPISGEITNMYDNGCNMGSVITFRDILQEQLLEEYYTLAMESGNIFPWEYNVKQNDFSFDENFLDSIGLQRGDESSEPVARERIKAFIHPEDMERALGELDDVINKKKGKFATQFRWCSALGGYEWWEFRCSSIHGFSELQVDKVIGICLNIQSFKETEEALRLSRDKAEQSDKLKSAFLANISHEIRTPLNAIVGFADLLTDMNLEKEEQELFRDTIKKNCHLLLTLISDVIDISRIESGELDFDDEPYDLSQLIDNLIVSHHRTIPDHVELIEEVPPVSAVLNIDSVRITQVLDNLMSNAKKFTKKGSITIGYSVEEGKQVNFFVKDTGQGIPVENIDKIFSRFYKINSFIQGVGLGLPICKLIVNRYKGDIQVTSELNKGSCFTVSIPFAQEL